jgi:hypothetical protein
MRVYKDNAGRTWSISINVDAAKRLRDFGFDLNKFTEGDAAMINSLADDPVRMVDVLFVVVKPEADALKITDEDFGRSMGGDSLDAALTALMGEIIDFFPSRLRGILKAAWAKVETGRGVAFDRAMVRLEKLDIAKAINQAADKAEAEADASGNSSTSLPDVLGSTPAP